MAAINLKFRPTAHTLEFPVSVHGTIDTLAMKANVNMTVDILWLKHRLIPIKEERFTQQSMEIVNIGWHPSFSDNPYITSLRDNLHGMFPAIKGCNIHYSKISTQKRIYWFLKYMDKTYTSTSEYGEYMSIRQTVAPEYRGIISSPSRIVPDYYPYPNCPNIIHHPKLFSWNEARNLCSHVNGTLPEFLSKSDEVELISVIKQSPRMFPVDTVFIGLQQRKVS